MLIWFVTLAVLGVRWIVREPIVLGAIDPGHAVTFFRQHGLHGVAVLGAVFLVVTGGEALYADMGHFGRRPIRIAWFVLVLPALLVNYFGQGAMLLINPQAASQPFFLLAPGWALLPLVALATAWPRSSLRLGPAKPELVRYEAESVDAEVAGAIMYQPDTPRPPPHPGEPDR